MSSWIVFTGFALAVVGMKISSRSDRSILNHATRFLFSIGWVIGVPFMFSIGWVIWVLLIMLQSLLVLDALKMNTRVRTKLQSMKAPMKREKVITANNASVYYIHLYFEKLFTFSLCFYFILFFSL